MVPESDYIMVRDGKIHFFSSPYFGTLKDRVRWVDFQANFCFIQSLLTRKDMIFKAKH